jgi:hypothetical protein
MDDSLPVRLVECIGHLNAQSQRLFDGERSFSKALFEGFAFEVFHYQEL